METTSSLYLDLAPSSTRYADFLIRVRLGVNVVVGVVCCVEGGGEGSAISAVGVRVTHFFDVMLNGISVFDPGVVCFFQKCHVKKKDIRKFLDGIYVSDKGTIDTE